LIPYKDDNPSRRFPFFTLLIIALNISVFLLEVLSGTNPEKIVRAYGAIPHNIITFQSDQPISPVFTLFTSMFMHGGLLHLGGNMLYFWIFGNNIEDRLGHLRFILFYLFCGLVSAYAHALSAPDSNIPMIGASGAVSGILGSYILLFPRAGVHTIVFLGFFIQIVKVPALIVIGFWAIIQIVNGLVSHGMLQQGGVAWFAHVGGFLAGLLTIKLWQPRRSGKW
jgi:membrane associated rhomboid family serine protease